MGDIGYKGRVETKGDGDYSNASPKFDIKAFHIAKMLQADFKKFKKDCNKEISDARIWALIAVFVAVCSLAIQMISYLVS